MWGRARGEGGWRPARLITVSVVLFVAMGASVAEAADEGPRLDGDWVVESIESLGSTLVGEDGGDPPDEEFAFESSVWWRFTPTCGAGACDVVVDNGFGECTLTFDGSGWSGHLARSIAAPGCVDVFPDPSGPPPVDQPASIVAIDTIATPDGLLATSLEVTWTSTAGTASWNGDGDGNFESWIHYWLQDLRVALTRVMPAESELPPTSTPPTTSAVPGTTVVAPPTTAPDTHQPEAGAASGTPGRLETSALSVAVRTTSEVSRDPAVIATNLILAVALVLLMPFPSELFNRTMDENYDRISAWYRRFLPALKRGSGSTVGSLAAVTIAGGILAGLLDPSFGLSLQSLAVVVAGLLAVAVVIAVSVGVSAAFARRKAPSVDLVVRALPGALVVAVACVILSRAVGFQPGYLYGVLAGLVVGSTLSEADEGRSAALSGAALGLVSLIAWVAWMALPAAGEASFGRVVADTFLAAVFVAGLEGMAFGLIPMRFLAGAQVLKWNRLVWGALFGLGLFAMIHLLAHPGQGYGPAESAAPFTTALVLFGGFGAASVVFWAWFRFRPSSPHEI